MKDQQVIISFTLLNPTAEQINWWLSKVNGISSNLTNEDMDNLTSVTQETKFIGFKDE